MSEQANLAAVQRWMELYNDDIDRMIDESYADTFSVVCPGLLEITDKEEFRKIEKHVLDTAPDRRFRIENSIVAGDKVIVECVLHGADATTGAAWETPWCAVLTLVDGKIVSDHTYLDAVAWPGVKDLPVARS